MTVPARLTAVATIRSMARAWFAKAMTRWRQLIPLVGRASSQSEEFDYFDLGNRVTYWDERNSVTTAYASNLANEYTSIRGCPRWRGCDERSTTTRPATSRATSLTSSTATSTTIG